MPGSSGMVRAWSLSLFARHLWAEIQHSLHWTWLLPFVIIALSIVLSRPVTPVANDVGQSVHNPTSSEVIVSKHKPVRTAHTPDYASNLRNDLELYLPLVSIFLAIPPLAREWQYGTVVQLALRRSLRYILLERLGIVLLYLLILTCLVSIVSLIVTVQPPDNGAIGSWLWDVICTVGPTTLFCSALALFVAIMTVNVVAGYMVVVVFWGINVLCMQALAQHGVVNNLLLYTLNSWRMHDQIIQPDQWWIGKVIWLVGSVVCMLGSLLLLRFETRLIRNLNE